ncbi:MAG: DNA ligase-1 [Motiliproteus sp.]|jgi:DNA ligase-1
MNFTPLNVSILATVLCQTPHACASPDPSTQPAASPLADADKIQPAATPRLMLANTYSEAIDIRQYWISEKLDGVRAYWDGQQLHSRQGYPIRAPLWFTQALPATPLDGELWRGRGQFEKTSATIRRYQPVPQEWQEIQYRVFDLPSSTLPFTQRIQQLQRLAQQLNIRHLVPLSYQQVTTHAQLLALLEQQTAAGAEGLMLNRADAYYQGMRSDAMLKLKTHLDAEAVVLRHQPGKGKYRGMLGAIVVRLASGQHFKIGSGFTDKQRLEPPPIGSIVSFKYYGLTHRGTPRFASFIRQYDEEPNRAEQVSP